MSLKTRLQLRKVKKQFSPSTQFKRELSRKLDSVWKVRYGKPAWYQSGLLYKVGAFAVVLLILAGGGGAYAYSSPTVTEGNPLYPVKKAIEKVEEITKVTPEAKVKFYLKTIARREAEKEQLEQEENKIEDQNIELERKDTSPAKPKRLVVHKIIDTRIEKTKKSLEQAEEKLERLSRIINKVEAQEQKLRPEVKAKIEGRLQIRKKRLETVSEIRDQREQKIESQIQAAAEEENTVEAIREDSLEIAPQQSGEAQIKVEESGAQIKTELRSRFELRR